MTTRILCVDDEPNLLHAIERQFHKRFEIVTAVGPELGLQAIAERGPFAVVVSDLRMPRMDGIQFLARVRQISPDTVRIMLTVQADLCNAMEAVNQGNVFQFLSKPCPPDTLGRALESALERYRLIQSERELLERTLTGSVEVLSEVLGLVNPSAFGRAQRIRRYVAHIATALNLHNRWQYDLAAMLSQIGCITVAPDILDKIYAAQPLDDDEKKAFASHCAVGHDLLVKIPRLEHIANMVAAQQAPGKGRDGSDPVSVGAGLLKTATDFDEQIVFTGNREGYFDAFDARDGKLLWKNVARGLHFSRSGDVLRGRKAVRSHRGRSRNVRVRLAGIVRTAAQRQAGRCPARHFEIPRIPNRRTPCRRRCWPRPRLWSRLWRPLR